MPGEKKILCYENFFVTKIKRLLIEKKHFVLLFTKKVVKRYFYHVYCSVVSCFETRFSCGCASGRSRIAIAKLRARQSHFAATSMKLYALSNFLDGYIFREVVTREKKSKLVLRCWDEGNCYTIKGRPSFRRSEKTRRLSSWRMFFDRKVRFSYTRGESKSPTS